MFAAVTDYFRTFAERFAAAWNRFWYTPSDPLSLGVVRILTGLVALYLHLTYSSDLVRLFAAEGMLPLSAIESWELWVQDFNVNLPLLHRFSYLSYLDSPTELWIAHALGFVVLAAFTAGFFTRTSTVLSMLVVLAYFHRAPMLVSQVEPIVAMLLFYLCFGPAGGTLSVDRWLHQRRAKRETNALQRTELVGPPAPSVAATVSLRLIQLHFAAIVFMIGMAKLAGGASNVWWSGEAVWMLAARPEGRLLDWTWLAGHQYLIDFWTRSIVLFELLFPLLVWNRTGRPLLLAWAVLHWSGLALLTGYVAWCLMMLVASLAFVSGESWRKLLPVLRSNSATT